jgi:hypothetical protein
MLGAAILVGMTQGEPFFWDTVQLGAMQGDWFYQQHFQTWLLPDQIDSGHIPAFGWYLAACWKLLGQDLWVSHWAMWPWIVLVGYQWWRLLGQQPGKWSRGWGFALLLASPLAISQLSLISPDIILLGAFLLAWNSILERRNGMLALAVVLLGLVSLRGMLVALALFCWQLYQHWPNGYRRRWTFWIGPLLPYLPGGILALVYLTYHYWLKGWVVVHNESPWAASFALSEGWTTLRQLLILIWRLLDFGYLFLWLALGILLWHARPWTKSPLSQLALLTTLLLFLGIPVIMGQGLAQHRYLLPALVTLTYLIWQLLNHYVPTRQLRFLAALMLIGLFSGNLWIYPTGIAQGWDATLLHKAFFRLDKLGKKTLNEENITLSELHGEFPFIAPQHYYWLNGDTSQIRPYDRRSVLAGEQRYIYYTDVINAYEKTDLEILDSHCTPVFRRSMLGLNYTLYECE